MLSTAPQRAIESAPAAASDGAQHILDEMSTSLVSSFLVQNSDPGHLKFTSIPIPIVE